MVGPSISKLEMNQREAVSPGEQLGITFQLCKVYKNCFQFDYLL